MFGSFEIGPGRARATRSHTCVPLDADTHFDFPCDYPAKRPLTRPLSRLTADRSLKADWRGHVPCDWGLVAQISFERFGNVMY